MPASAVRDLRARLDRLGGPARPRPRHEVVLPRGFEAVPTPFGDAMLREDVIPLPPLDPDPGSVAYLDTETTGLNGGAGTYVFAAAVARPIDCGLRLAQLFLPQPGLEAAFLHRLREELEAANGLASFNGGSFDLPVLRTRWVMARMPGELASLPHVDLLTLVRALFRHRMESCTLRIVEERLLGYERDDPIASALVPDAYFAYLHRGSSPMLEAVLEHNRLDVISLVHLHSRLLSRLEGGDAGMDASDWLALGRHRLRRGARADGWHALRNAAGFAGRAPANFDEDEAAATAGLLIARRLARRPTSVAGAERLLGWLESRVASDVRLPVARARLLEWRRREPQLALAVVEAAQSRIPDEAAALESRRTRLRRKAANRQRLTKHTETPAASLFG
jgi:RNase_H superfamily